MVIEKGKTVREVSRNLGFHESILSRWNKDYLKRKDYESKGLNYDELVSEIKRLKKELRNT